MFEGLIGGFQEILHPFNLLLVFAGTALGILVGALPGLSSPMAIVILLPLTYTMEPLQALLVMIGVYVGTKLGGSFSAILLRTPGTPAGACTALDGHPMAERGEAGLALGYAVMGSTFGGIFGWIIAVTFIPVLASVALKSGNADIALVGILGLLMVSSFVRGSTLKGLIGVLLGLLISTIGLDPVDATLRYTFGFVDLMSGIPFAAALTGFFGIAVVLSDLKLAGNRSEIISGAGNMALPSVRDMLKRWKAVVVGSLFGTGVGAVPGVGAEGATWLAYGTMKRQAKNPDDWGKGEPDGIVTPEATNNATTGGTMIPMLTLGIPGDGSTAVILGALILHGIEPGVMLFQTNADLVYGILAGLLISTIFMFLIAWRAISLFIIVLQQDRAWLFPFVLLLATIGAFATVNNVYAIYIAIFFGVVGYFLEKRNFPVVTVVLGIILGPIIEANLRLALVLSANDWMTFVATTPRLVLVALIAVVLSWEVFTGIRDAAEGRRSRIGISD
tara:strand:+ start:7503 stop:9014 length:1512 start_codon:yes stop_codon:yes gene_type:complete